MEIYRTIEQYRTHIKTRLKHIEQLETYRTLQNIWKHIETYWALLKQSKTHRNIQKHIEACTHMLTYLEKYKGLPPRGK